MTYVARRGDCALLQDLRRVRWRYLATIMDVGGSATARLACIWADGGRDSENVRSVIEWRVGVGWYARSRDPGGRCVPASPSR